LVLFALVLYFQLLRNQVFTKHCDITLLIIIFYSFSIDYGMIITIPTYTFLRHCICAESKFFIFNRENCTVKE